MDAAIHSEQATLARFDRAQERTIRDMGYGDTVGALKITGDALQPLSVYIGERIKSLSCNPKARSEEHRFLQAIGTLSSETLALATLNAALHSIAQGEVLKETADTIGSALHGEAWAAGLLEHDPELAGKIDRVVRRKHGALKYRKQAARSIAARAGYKAERWSAKEKLTAGLVLLKYLLEALPETFVKDVEQVGDKTKEWLTITPGALENAERAIEQALRGSPVFLPSTEPLKSWTSWFDGGYWDERARFRASIIRARDKEAVGAIRSAMQAGAMQPFLNAVNTLQAVPWTINKRMLGIVQWAFQNDVHVEGMPPITDLPMPQHPEDWDSLSVDEQRAWKIKAGKVKQRNRTFTGQRVLMRMDLETANQMVDAERFWTPMNCDWRGRVYATTSFNFQRDDRVRALFLFADGQPIGEEGLKWLKVHVANCGDFDKVSKRSIDERVKWTDEHLTSIEQMACTPTKDTWWTNADKPFLFLSAAMELVSAIRTGPSFVTRLPVSFDGSCSGLQHLSAMTRDESTARLVNLLPLKEPQDVYMTIADAVVMSVEKDASAGSAIALLWLEYLKTHDRRKLVKRNVMTYSYSSKKFGMAQQLMEDVMRPLELSVLSGEYPAHPFGEDDGREAAKYLAGITYDAIEAIVHRPAQAMTMLQKTARTLAHEEKPVVWNTPLGLPWINRYHEPHMRRLNLWMHDARVQVLYADGHKPEIDKDRAANGVSPNFVHACDATHLLMVANASAAEHITQLATVHDSFGCLASQAGRFRQIIREQLVALYEQNDVLAQVLEQAKHDLTVHNLQRLPEVPAKGSLNLKDILSAEYAFA